jgi:hypothetical protein
MIRFSRRLINGLSLSSLPFGGESSHVPSFCRAISSPSMEHVRYNGCDGDWLDLVRQRIDLRHPYCDLNLATLRVHSMRQEYHESLLHDFYENLMIPAFPIREERIDIEEWIDCLSGQRNPEINANEGEIRPPTAMDVMLLLCDSRDTQSTQDPSVNVLAGIVVDYFRLSQVGLMSYLVVHPSYRQCGIMSLFHAHEAISCLHEIHQEHLKYGQQLHSEQANDRSALGFTHIPWSPDIRAILCEVNTVEAGDVSVQELAQRHAALQNLGYRLLDFPYMQPPFTVSYDKENDMIPSSPIVPFSPIMLLIYQPEPTTINSPACDDRSAVPCEIDSGILCDFVVDFFMCTCDCESLAETVRCHGGEYYQLIQWYRHHHPTTKIMERIAPDAASQHQASVATPLEDPKLHWMPTFRSFVQSCSVVAIVGAGASGLAAAVTLAEQTLPEMHHHERENASSSAAIRLTHIFILEADSTVGGRIRTIETDLDASSTGESLWETDRNRDIQFAPRTIPLGAEFVHGINSEINRIAAAHSWQIERTFDYSHTPGEVDVTETDSSPGQQVTAVKSFLNDMLAATHASTIDLYEITEASREECQWGYTEHLSRIAAINEQYDKGLGFTKIQLIPNCAVSCIRNIGSDPDRKLIEVLGRKASHIFHCDKVIIAGPWES